MTSSVLSERDTTITITIGICIAPHTKWDSSAEWNKKIKYN